MSSQQYDIFKNAVEIVINKWTGLRLAVENGMGGSSGLNTAKEMVDYIAKYSYNDDVDAGDVSEALEEIMEQEFCTYLEDDSPKEIGIVLKKYHRFCKEGNLDELQKDLSLLPPGPLWLREGIIKKPKADNSVEEDGIMELETPVVASSSGGTSNMEESDLDSEWIHVKSRKKRN